MHQPAHGPRVRLAARLALLTIAPLAACATDDDHQKLRRLPPAPLVVVVDAQAPTVGDAEALHFAATAAEMQGVLVRELRQLDASSRVVTRAELGADAADLTVTLVPKGAVGFSYAGTANVLGAGGLWLVTWIGGLLVPDSRYDLQWNATCRYARGGADQDFIERRVADASVDLSFFDRNDLLSVQGLQSLVLPPFWTSDQTAKTSAALTQSSIHEVAQQIAGDLKRDFEQLAENELGCSIRVQTPPNGRMVTSSEVPIALSVTTSSTETVSKVTISVNGAAATDLRITPAGQRTIEARGLLKNLKPNQTNWVRIQVTAGEVNARTLRLGDRQ